MDSDKFTKDFSVSAPATGSSLFGIKMRNMTVSLQSNYSASYLHLKNTGVIDAVISNIEIDLDVELDTQAGDVA